MAEIEVKPPVSESEKSEATSEPWYKEFGLDSEEAVKAAFVKNKTDLNKYKPEAKKAAEYEAELAELRKAKEAREQAEMTEIQKAQAALDKQKAEMQQLQAAYEKSLKDNVYERAVSARLGNFAETDRELVRTLYAAAGDWSDEEELADLLDKIDTKWKAHLDALGGEKRSDVGGSTRKRMIREPGAVTKDEVILAQDISSGGALSLMKRKFGK